MGALQDARITLPELMAGEGHFRRIHDDLQRRGEGLANPDEATPATVRTRLAGIVGRLLKQEIQLDPAGRGYAGVPNGQKLQRLTQPYAQVYGEAAGYAVVLSVPEIRSHRVTLTKIGGAAPLLLGANIPPGSVFRINGRRYSVMGINAADIVINMASVLPAPAEIGVFESAEVIPPRIYTVLQGIPHAPNDLNAADFADSMS